MVNMSREHEESKPCSDMLDMHNKKCIQVIRRALKKDFTKKIVKSRRNETGKINYLCIKKRLN